MRENKQDAYLTWERYCKEILPYYLFVTKGYGLTVSDINNSCPKDLEPYVEAYKLERKRNDEEMWHLGMYIECAVSVAVEHNLNGKKAKSEYFKKPLLQEYEEEHKVLTEEELQREREKFVMQLKINKANFDLSRKAKEQ